MNGDRYTIEDIVEALVTVEEAMELVNVSAIVINDKEFAVGRRALGLLRLRLETFGLVVRAVAAE